MASSTEKTPGQPEPPKPESPIEAPIHDEAAMENTKVATENTSGASDAAPFTILTRRTKLFIVFMTAFATLFSPFSSFIYLPAITPIAHDYGRSIADINLTVTLYQVMQAIAPLFLGDLSDQLGRRPVYLLSFTIFLGANIGLALQDDYAALMVLRALQSTGCSATVAIGSAVMADFTTAADRGGYITAVQSSTMFAPALAPVVGGILTQFLGWRSTFWFLVIAAGVFLAVYIPFVPETARKIVGNGSIPPPRLNTSLASAVSRSRKPPVDIETLSPPPQKSRTALPTLNILASLRIIAEKDILPLLLFMSLFVMANYAILVPLQDITRRRFAFDDLQVGLCFIPFSVGSVFGAAISGRLLNWNYARVARAHSLPVTRNKDDTALMRQFPIEQARLDLMWPFTILAVAMIIAWGWVVSESKSLAPPLVVLFFAGAGVAAPVSILTTLLVDLYPMNAGRVSGTFNLTRATFSAVGTAVVQYIIDAWGYGFTYLFLGLVVLAASPCVLVVRKWGPGWREERWRRFNPE
ncbi:quinidine resistance protein 2 [Echria macrotheca]|uniref:Quinidine resistance protein 2 n=1 Tax=Echria macrotheca TaxID=438768 RepID=A0AAJ0F9G6_9PEZI|nr:quinidine resistance protein 2 [Echria macrotheca]